MKFGYSYKTSDGVRHESVYHADSREDVFAALREKGIRPIKVWEIAQPKSSRVKKVMLGVIAVGCLVAITSVVSFRKGGATAVAAVGAMVAPQEEDRSQIYGDPGIIQLCESKNWANVFEDPGELFLARFAQPGIHVNVVGRDWRKTVAASLKVRKDPICVAESDSPEIAKMKRIVNGMKRELAEYVSDGGTVEQYIDEVLERQSIEEKILISAKAEFEKLEKKATKENRDEVIAEWNAKNTILRQMGLRTVIIPERVDSLGY